MNTRTQKPQRGRPPKAAADVKGAIFSIRLSDAERAAVNAAAGSAGQVASEWARAILLAAAGVEA